MAEYMEGVGRRKTATARVRLYPGTGDIVVNDKPMQEYFGRDLDRMFLRQPLVLTGTENSFNIVSMSMVAAITVKPPRFVWAFRVLCAYRMPICAQR